LLIHLGTARLGPAPWVIRLPALVAGILLIPATYLLVCRLADRSAAILAAALVAGSSTLISYPANGRGYTMLVLLATALATGASRLVDGGRLRDWAAFTLLIPLGFFTIPVMLYPCGGIVLWMLLASAWRKARGGVWPVRVDRLALALLLAGA